MRCKCKLFSYLLISIDDPISDCLSICRQIDNLIINSFFWQVIHLNASVGRMSCASSVSFVFQLISPTSPVYVHASVDVFTRTSFLPLPTYVILLTHEVMTSPSRPVRFFLFSRLATDDGLGCGDEVRR